MGTRGAVGFHKDGVDKITYNHFDSYPSGLGHDVITFIQDTPTDELNEIFDRIVLVKDTYPEGSVIATTVDITAGTQPTPEQIAEVKDILEGRKNDVGDIVGSMKVSTGQDEEWYCLLRDAQGDLDAYRQGLRYMIDNVGFMRDSLFNEWSYILNLDTEKLEVYRGFNTQGPQEGNRYEINQPYEEFYAVRLLATFSFDKIRDMNADDLVVRIESLAEKQSAEA